MRWSRFKDFEPERKFNVFKDEVFPFIKSLLAQVKIGSKMNRNFCKKTSLNADQKADQTMPEHDQECQNLAIPWHVND